MTTDATSVEPEPGNASGAAWFVGTSLLVATLATLATVSAGLDPTLLAFILALSPAVIAIVLAWREGNGALRKLMRRLAMRPARSAWYLVLLIPFGGYLAVDAIAVLLGEPLTGMFDQVLPAILIVPLVVLLPAFAEELAWRGFALPRVMTRMSVLRAAIVLGIPWTLIHVPLYLPGQMNANAAIWPMLTQVMAYSVVLAWIFVGTGGSVLMTGLFHTMLNGLVPLTNGVEPDLAWAIRGIVFPVIAILVVLLGGFRGLRRPSIGLAVPAPAPR